MESTAAQPAKEKSVYPAALSGQERRAPHKPAPDATPLQNPKAIGYGLPCSHCRAYYPADMTACPICKSAERVSPNAVAALPVTPVAPQPETIAQIDDDRER